MMRLHDLYPATSIRAATGKISKLGAGYVHKDGTDYRCKDCISLIPQRRKCEVHSIQDTTLPNGYCIQWVYGKPKGVKPLGCVTPLESGYGELKNGTKCIRCAHFNGRDDCDLVDKESPGDDPYMIHPQACCDNQTPKVLV